MNAIQLNDRRNGILKCLNETRRILVMSESYEQINSIDGLITKTNITTENDEFVSILLNGRKLQNEAQASWEERIK